MALLGRLVRGVAEGVVPVGQTEGVVHQPADEDLLELQTDLHDVGLAVEADAGLSLGRERAVPGVTADGIGRRQDEARVIRIDVVGVPVDVDEGVEVLVHRGLRQGLQGLLEVRLPAMAGGGRQIGEGGGCLGRHHAHLMVWSGLSEDVTVTPCRMYIPETQCHVREMDHDEKHPFQEHD